MIAPGTLPPMRHDLRVQRLHKAFGRGRPFSTAEAARVLRLSPHDAFALLFHDPGLADDAFRIAHHHGDWWVLPRPPEQAFAERVLAENWLVLREQTEWTAQEFATAANIPFPTSNYLLSLLVRFGKITKKPYADAYEMPRRRKITTR